MSSSLITRVLLALGLTLGVASPALADCCDSLFGCAVAVVTEGLSCVLQEIVSTVQNLVHLVSNVLERTSGTTQRASDGAVAYVNQTISQMSDISQLSATDLAAALQQAHAIYEAEAAPVVTATRTAPPMTASSPTTATATPNRTARPGVASAAAAPEPAAAGASNSAQAIHSSAAAASPESGVPPHGALAGLLEKGVKVIESLKAAGDPDVAKVREFMTQARQSEGPGLQSATAVADKAINAPLRDMLSHLNNLLADPTHIFDPSDVVNQLANSVLDNLDTNIGQLVEGITSGPQKAFDAAQPAYDELLTNAERAKAIAAAMSRAHTERSQASQNALSDLLPFPTVASSSNTRAKSLATGARPMYAQLMSSATTRKQQIAVAPERDLKAISPLITELKALRAKAATARAAMPTYQANFSRQLNASMAGKTQAQINAQRDSLITVARTQFAGDPKTRDAVIRLLTTETGKIRAEAHAP